MTSQLEELDEQFQLLSQRAREIVARAGAKLAERPAPNRWSIAECLEHLRVSSDPYVPILTKALADARKKGMLSDRPYRLDFIGKLMIWTLEPPPKFKFPAPPAFLPAMNLRSDQVLPQFLASQAEIRTLIRLADGLAADRIKIQSPFEPRVRYNIWSAMCIAASHQRRHLWQAEQALKQIG